MKKIMAFLLAVACASTVLTKDNESEPMSEKGPYKFLGMTWGETEKAVAQGAGGLATGLMTISAAKEALVSPACFCTAVIASLLGVATVKLTSASIDNFIKIYKNL